MPIDVSRFVGQPNTWGGLYNIADRLEKRQLTQQQLALQQQSKRNAAGAFLQNYLDPKDYLSGTAYDPMILQGLQDAMQQGAQLAAAGADSPTLMMSLGPMVNRLTTYSTNAKNINKQVDDQISKMKEAGLTGYNYSALKDEALQNAFFKTDESGQRTLNPQGADPSQNYIQKVLETSPSKVTTAAGLDLFAKSSPMQKITTDQNRYSKFGEQNRRKVNVTGQAWLIPEYDDRTGQISTLVPKYDLANDAGEQLFQTVNIKGKAEQRPVRLLDEGIFDDMMQRRPDIADYLKGIVMQNIQDYSDQTGNEISLNDPRAKLVARALAYEELDRRKAPGIEQVNIYDKPSPQQVSLNVNMTPQAIQNREAMAAATAKGRTSVTGGLKLNAVEAIGRAMNGDPEVLQGDRIEKNGRQVFDITSVFQGGGLKAGRGVNYQFKGIFVDPDTKSLIVEKESKDQFGLPTTNTETIPENQIGQFMYRIAQSNNVGYGAVKSMLEKMGYKNNKFTKATIPNRDSDAQSDFERRRTWRDAIKSPFGQSLNLNQ